MTILKTSTSPLICKHAGHSSFELRRVYADTDREFVSVPDLEGKEVWVNICGQPSTLTYNLYLKRCFDCLCWFSSPWEPLCVPCFRATPVGEREHSGPYRGWRWAARQLRAYDEYVRNL